MYTHREEIEERRKEQMENKEEIKKISVEDVDRYFCSPEIKKKTICSKHIKEN